MEKRLELKSSSQDAYGFDTFSENRSWYYRCSNEKDTIYTLIRYTGKDITPILEKHFSEIILKTESLPLYRLYDIKE